jgi:dihydrofolate reductase
MKNNLVNEIIINYNPYVLNKGINLFEGDFFEQKLELNKIIQEKDGIVQIWYKVIIPL